MAGHLLRTPAACVATAYSYRSVPDTHGLRESKRQQQPQAAQARPDDVPQCSAPLTAAPAQRNR